VDALVAALNAVRSELRQAAGKQRGAVSV
jgi:hypothetical protein